MPPAPQGPPALALPRGFWKQEWGLAEGFWGPKELPSVLNWTPLHRPLSPGQLSLEGLTDAHRAHVPAALAQSAALLWARGEGPLGQMPVCTDGGCLSWAAGQRLHGGSTLLLDPILEPRIGLTCLQLVQGLGGGHPYPGLHSDKRVPSASSLPGCPLLQGHRLWALMLPQRPQRWSCPAATHRLRPECVGWPLWDPRVCGVPVGEEPILGCVAVFHPETTAAAAKAGTPAWARRHCCPPGAKPSLALRCLCHGCSTGPGCVVLGTVGWDIFNFLKIVLLPACPRAGSTASGSPARVPITSEAVTCVLTARGSLLGSHGDDGATQSPAFHVSNQDLRPPSPVFLGICLLARTRAPPGHVSGQETSLFSVLA